MDHNIASELSNNVSALSDEVESVSMVLGTLCERVGGIESWHAEAVIQLKRLNNNLEHIGNLLEHIAQKA